MKTLHFTTQDRGIVRGDNGTYRHFPMTPQLSHNHPLPAKVGNVLLAALLSTFVQFEYKPRGLWFQAESSTERPWHYLEARTYMGYNISS